MGFGRVRVPALWVQIPNGFWLNSSPSTWFKSHSEVNSFISSSVKYISEYFLNHYIDRMIQSLKNTYNNGIVVVQSPSHVPLYEIPWTAAHQASHLLVFPSSCSLNLWCHPAISSSVTLVSVCFHLSQHQNLFHWVGCSLKSQFFELCSGLFSFNINCFDLTAVQGTLKTSPAPHNLKALILWHSAFFMAQLSHLYMTIVKPTAKWSLCFPIHCLGCS